MSHIFKGIGTASLLALGAACGPTYPTIGNTQQDLKREPAEPKTVNVLKANCNGASTEAEAKAFFNVKKAEADQHAAFAKQELASGYGQFNAWAFRSWQARSTDYVEPVNVRTEWYDALGANGSFRAVKNVHLPKCKAAATELNKCGLALGENPYTECDTIPQSDAASMAIGSEFTQQYSDYMDKALDGQYRIDKYIGTAEADRYLCSALLRGLQRVAPGQNPDDYYSQHIKTFCYATP